MQLKDKLRKKYLSIRKKKYFEINKDFFIPLTKLIKKQNKKKNINLSFYYPSFFETNVLKIFKTNLKNKIRSFLPVLSKNNSMNFYQWNNKEVLQINKFGMLEPIMKLKPIIPEIILVPLLAYDNKKID